MPINHIPKGYRVRLSPFGLASLYNTRTHLKFRIGIVISHPKANSLSSCTHNIKIQWDDGTKAVYHPDFVEVIA